MHYTIFCEECGFSYARTYISLDCLAKRIQKLGLQANPADVIDFQKECNRNATEKAKFAREKFHTYFKNKGPSFITTHLFAMCVHTCVFVVCARFLINSLTNCKSL
jgi:hypothetical protein